MKSIKVIFFGDSVCVGQYVSIHLGWVPRISSKLGAFGIQHNRQIIVGNASANGRTTRQALEHMAYEIQTQHVDIMIIQFGMNDCNYWETDNGVPRVSRKAFGANIEEIIERGFNSGAQKIFLNTNHITGLNNKIMPKVNISYQESNAQYSEIIRGVIQQYDRQVILNDIEEVFYKYTKGNSDKLLDLILPEPDLLHLSEKGHDLYFKTVYPKVEKAVVELIDQG